MIYVGYDDSFSVFVGRALFEWIVFKSPISGPALRTAKWPNHA